MKTTLKENFEKVNNVLLAKKQLELRRIELEKIITNKALQEYIEVRKELKAADEELANAKIYLYEGMMEEDIDSLDGTTCNVTLKRPYVKTAIDTKKFLADFKPETAMYKTYVKETEVKGNITIKERLMD